MAGCAPNTPTCNLMFTMTVGRSQQVGRWRVPVRSAGPTEHLLCSNSVRGQDGGGNRWAHSSASVLGGSGDQLCDSATWHLVNAISLTILITRCNYTVNYTVGFPDSSFGKESACNAGDPVLIPGSRGSSGEGIGCPLQYWTSLVAQLVKNPPAMWETWVQSLGWEDPLKKGKVTHSSILAWRIP